MKASLKTAFCILGAIIGAGFATGKEISSFFVRFGYISIFGIVLSSILFGMYVFFVAKKINEEKIDSPFEYIKSISGKAFANIAMIITYLFLFVSFSVMITGGASILKQYIGVSHFLASAIVCILCTLVLVFGKNGVVNASFFLTPVMMIGIVLLAFLSLKDVPAFFTFDNTLTSSVIYVSYNTLPMLTLLCALSDCTKTKKEIKLTSMFLSILVFVLMFCLWYVLVINDAIYLKYDMPIVKIANKYGTLFEMFYSVVLFFAMLTTAFSSGIGILDAMDKKIKNTNNTVNAVVLCVLAFFMSYIGFASFINIVYPFFGYLGLSVFLLIFLDILRKMKKMRKNESKRKIF